MFSILLNKSTGGFSYYVNNDGTVYKAETLEAVQEKLTELIQTIPLGKIIVVKNCVIEPNLIVTEE